MSAVTAVSGFITQPGLSKDRLLSGVFRAPFLSGAVCRELSAEWCAVRSEGDPSHHLSVSAVCYVVLGTGGCRETGPSRLPTR